AFRSDLGFATEADSVGTIRDPLERCSHALNPAEIGLNASDRHVPFRSSLYPIQAIGNGLDSDFVTPTQGIFRAVQNCMQHLFEVSEFCMFHRCPPLPRP